MTSRKSTTNKARKASFDDLGRDLLLFAEAIQDGLDGLHAFADRIQPMLSELPKALASLVEGVSATLEAIKRLDEAGWLPHVTTPWSALATAEASARSQAIEKHYRDNWAAVKGTFTDRLGKYAIDNEAKATFVRR